jgi:hypothetical protein
MSPGFPPGPTYQCPDYLWPRVKRFGLTSAGRSRISELRAGAPYAADVNGNRRQEAWW